MTLRKLMMNMNNSIRSWLLLVVYIVLFVLTTVSSFVLIPYSGGYVEQSFPESSVIRVTSCGAQGGGPQGILGDCITCEMDYTSNETLYVFVGGTGGWNGTGGYNSNYLDISNSTDIGGSGGNSDIRIGNGSQDVALVSAGGGSVANAGDGTGRNFNYCSGRTIALSSEINSGDGYAAFEVLPRRRFQYTGTVQKHSFRQSGILTVMACGAQGGGGWQGSGGPGGLGGCIKSRIDYQAQEVLNVVVGGAGGDYLTGGYNGGGSGSIVYVDSWADWYWGGGGGGASDVRIGGESLDNRVIVGGGGGGVGYFVCGGAGGGLVGGDGCFDVNDANNAATGGSQTSGGVPGCYFENCGTSGSLGQGGDGDPTWLSGGGGGGYYGGGGGEDGGGGGSSYSSGTILANARGVNSGNGYVEMTLTPATYFSYSGSIDSHVFTLPGLLKITACGASGGGLSGANGDCISCRVPYQPYVPIYVNVGGTGSVSGTGGYNGGGNSTTSIVDDLSGGGGGGSDVRIGKSISAAVVVGASGGKGDGSYGGIGGGSTICSGVTIQNQSKVHSGDGYVMLELSPTPTHEISYSGASEVVTIPASPFDSLVTLTACGASGGVDASSSSLALSNYGACLTCQIFFPAFDAQSLVVTVGGAGGSSGQAGYNGGGAGTSRNGRTGGGGGGGSEVRLRDRYDDAVLVSAGGGGGTSNGKCGGAGGLEGIQSCSPSNGPAYGGTPFSGGSGSCLINSCGSSGSRGQGGRGNPSWSGGGGGGGYFGGGGGTDGGGGGSSFCAGALLWNSADNLGDGKVNISIVYFGTDSPTSLPTSQPSSRPSKAPSSSPSNRPTSIPSSQPSVKPSGQPTMLPTCHPSGYPTCQPSSQPTVQPSGQPTSLPTQPSGQPSGRPSTQPSRQPTARPSTQPTSQPSQPTGQPTSQPSINQISGLFQLFVALNGEQWTVSTGWEISGTKSDGIFGVSLDQGGWVTSIDLPKNNLRGKLPNDLMHHFPFLKRLDLSGNQVSGALDISESWPDLEYFDLSNNRLQEAIPAMIGRLSRLYFLDLSSNSFTSTLPADLSLLVNIRHLDLSGNSLSSSLPQLSALHECVYLDISYNNLTNDYSEGFVDFGLLPWKSLVYVSLAYNRFGGVLPELEFSESAPPVTSLSLSGNSFTSVPASYFALPSIKSLKLDFNNISGSLVLPISLSRSLKYIDLSSNRITGSLSDTLCRSATLKTVSVIGNQLDCFAACIQIVGFLHDTPLLPCVGTQDEALCHLASGVLNRRLAKVTTALPTQTWSPRLEQISRDPINGYFAAASRIVGLDISPRPVKFSVSFSQEILRNPYENITICGDVGSLCYTFHGVDAEWPIAAITPLVIFASTLTISASRLPYRKTSIEKRYAPYLSSFSLSVTPYYDSAGWQCQAPAVSRAGALSPEQMAEGPLQSVSPCQWFGVTCKYGTTVTELNISGMQFTGPIPSSIGLLTSLQTLIASDNAFTGTIPSEFANLHELKRLDLSGNQFLGTVPEFLGSLTSLEMLTLGHNLLSGSLKTFYLNMSDLKALDLSYNRFTGTVPAALCLREPIIGLEGNSFDCVEASTCWDNSTANLGSAAMCTTGPYSLPTEYIVTIAVVGSLVLLVLIVVCVRTGNRVWIRINLLHLPIHSALLLNSKLSEALFESKKATGKHKDHTGSTALDIYLRMYVKTSTNVNKRPITEDMVFDLVFESLPQPKMESDVTEDAECANLDESYPWHSFVEVNDDVCCNVVRRVLMAFPGNTKFLANAMDAQQRRAIDVACPRSREAINRSIWLHGRYELRDGPPEHKSATAAVLFCTDHGEEAPSEKGYFTSRPGIGAALKFMRLRAQFLSEISVRQGADLDPAFVVNIRYSYDGDAQDDDNAMFRVSAVQRGFADYPYCLVMDIADINLKRIIDQQNIVGNDWDHIKLITKELAQCLEHLHSKQILHGDIKPLNVVRVDGTLRIIDLDASVSFAEGRHQFAGSKFSSAYAPPELFFRLNHGSVVVKTFVTNPETMLPDLDQCEYDEAAGTYRHKLHGYLLVPAHPSMDMWALGALLYLMCTGLHIFQASVADNFEPEGLEGVYSWNNVTMEEKLSRIPDKYARNLLSLLLNCDPALRLDAAHVLEHPFISGHEPLRLMGELPQYDVFLSYRVDSDSDHVMMFYRALTAAGLKVWWDKECLLPGQPWEIGFCDGLMNSACFVCLLSRNAINNQHKPWQNFGMLEESSRCDNVLLEWQLAIELNQRKLIEGIFPVFIGDRLEDDFYSDYFSSQCHPNCPDISVKAVEEKLHEHLSRQGLGSPYVLKCTVRNVVGRITACQGAFFRGNSPDALRTVVNEIVKMREIVKSVIHPGISSRKHESSHDSSPRSRRLSSAHDAMMHAATAAVGPPSVGFGVPAIETTEAVGILPAMLEPTGSPTVLLEVESEEQQVKRFKHMFKRVLREIIPAARDAALARVRRLEGIENGQGLSSSSLDTTIPEPIRPSLRLHASTGALGLSQTSLEPIRPSLRARANASTVVATLSSNLRSAAADVASVEVAEASAKQRPENLRIRTNTPFGSEQINSEF